MRVILLALLMAATSLQSLAQRGRQTRSSEAGNNIFTFQPFGFVIAYNQFNPVVGIDYERILNKELGLGVHLPLMFGFNGPDGIFSDSYQHTAFYTAPGVRFHAGGNRHSHLDFSTGPSVIIGNQHYKPVSNYYYGTGTLAMPYDLGFAGIAVDNVLNIQRGQFIFGFNTRIGYTFDRNNSSRYFMDLGMHFGGRF